MSVLIVIVGVGLAVAALIVAERETATGGSDAPPSQTAPENPGTRPDAGAPADGTGETGGGWGIGPYEVLGWLAVALAIWVAYRAYRLYVVTNRNTQVVLADLGNSSGITALDATMPGLSLLARQEVLRRMERLRGRTRLASASDPGSPHEMATWLKATLPLPRAVIDTKLTDVAKAVAEGVQEGAKPAAQLLSLLVAPRGTMVSGRLQMDGDLPGRAGISLEVSDMEGLEEPRSDTFWEPDPPPTAEGSSKGETSSNEGTPKEGRSSKNPLALNPSGSGDGGDGTTSDAGVKEAAALLGLGQLYEQRSAFEQARTFYEEAAKKDPEDSFAREALLRVLSKPGRTPSERYRTLLEPVCRWLATELLRNKLLFEVSRFLSEGVRRRRAQVHNFVGSYHTYGGSNHDAFLRAAERELELAIGCDEEWYLPYANLGDVLSYMGYQRKDIPSTQREDNASCQREAIENYEEALKRLDRTPEETLPKAEDKIRLSCSIAQLLSDDPGLRRQAVNCIWEVPERHVESIEDSDARLVYILACAYAVLAGVASKVGVAEFGVNAGEAKERAVRLLERAFALDPTGDLRVWSKTDPDLADLPGKTSQSE